MGRAREIGVALLALASAGFAANAILPSFHLEGNAWEADQIVVATEGSAIDGVLSVLETWKGELAPGQRIEVAALASFAPAGERTTGEGFFARRPEVVLPMDRVVLFLRDRNVPVAWHERSYGDEYQHMLTRISVAWLHSATAYAFVQVMNPGPQVLVEVASEVQFRAQVATVVSERRAIEDLVEGVPDVRRRAPALEPFTRSSLYLASDLAFTELSKCQKAALPVLRRMLADPALARQHARAVRALAETGVEAVEADLEAILDREGAYWKKRAATLEPNWWGKGHPDGEDLFVRHELLAATLAAIGEHRIVACRDALERLAAVLHGSPALEDLDLRRTCDRVIVGLR